MNVNVTEKDARPQNSFLRIRSVDGSVYFITSRNAIDYLLHREFLIFVITSSVIYALIRGDADVPGVSGWPFIAVWTLVLSMVLGWLALSGGLMELLLRMGLIRQVWTPILLFPLNLIIESSVQIAMFWFADKPFKPLGMTLTDLTRDFCVLLLLDFLHGHYVVARHPYARMANRNSALENAQDAPLRRKDATNDAADLPKPSHVPEESRTDRDFIGSTAASGHFSMVQSDAAPTQTAHHKMVRIGTETFALADILMIRIEDHYLSITTRSGRSMQRAKLGAIEELHKGDVGIQINRSVWVAFSAIRTMQPAKNGQILLILTNGDEELVAKPRVYAFRQSHRTAAT